MISTALRRIQRSWYHSSPLLLLLLLPFSLVFFLLSTTRRQLFRWGILPSVKLPVPVIIVGNISVGGTGKTPLTLWLAEQLLADGWHPCIISRGFGGKGNTPQAVNHSSDTALVGDEPVLMAQRRLCPVWVGRDRPAAAQALLLAHPECDVILSDDGLQHYRLQRDVELVVIDGVRRFGNGFLLPAGPLREYPSRLHKVDAVITNGGQAEKGEFPMQLEGIHFYNLLNPEQTATATDFKGLSVHAIAGIGHPERFFAHLHKLGLTIHTHSFSDHYVYRAADLVYEGANALLMTEKDAVKCSSYADETCWVLRVDAHLDSTLTQLIIKKITP